MKKIFKKILCSFATFGALAMPISGIVSCSSNSNEDSLIILSGKTQVTDQGREFVNYFQGIDDFKSYSNDGAKKAKFITRNGDKFATELSTTFGSESFPSLYAAANPSTFKPYYKNAIAKFKDPDYDTAGISRNAEAVLYNKKLAGDKVNEIIKTLQTSGRSNLMLRDKEGHILGFPTYSEAMGLIYNKELFRKAGITIDPTSEEEAISSSDWNSKIHDGSNPKSKKAILTVNPKKDLTTPLKTKQLLEYIKAFLNDPSISITGISTYGKESWAFTSKVLGTSGIATAAINAGLNNQGAVMPGEIYEDKTKLTPDIAQSVLFNLKTSEGIKTMKEAFEFFIKKGFAKNFNNNQSIYNAFSAGQLLTMPQGTWVESTLNKTKSLKYGYLPLPLTGTITKIALDTVSHWIVSDQVNSHGRSEKQAKSFRTQAINFIYNQYLTNEGAKNLEKEQGLNNPYRKNKFLDEDSHPLIIDANKYEHFKWGIAFNKPGVGPTGYERNNLEWTEIITQYYEGLKTINDVVQKALDIWKK